MRVIDSSKPILVTGAGGYIASWIIEYLLEKGYRVRGTVRSLAKNEQLSHLEDMAKLYEGRLELFEADLLRHGSFQKAMEGCELVFHTASPFKISGVKDPQRELIDPALEGTRNVFLSVEDTPSVKRVVLTSSVAAIFGDAREIEDQPNQIFTEDAWNLSSSLQHQPYPFSKTLAEKEAWNMAGQQKRWDLVVMNPAFVLGPSRSRRTDSASTGFVRSLLNGTFKSGTAALYFGIVDVRDVAQAHILAGFTPSAAGRHILCNETLGMLEMAKILNEAHPGRFALPTREMPKWLLWLMAPKIGFTRKFISDNVGFKPLFENRKAIAQFNLRYRPVRETLLDQAAQLIQDGLIKNTRP
jgi:nucleoside-diphosphate-sugar epimerase